MADLRELTAAERRVTGRYSRYEGKLALLWDRFHPDGTWPDKGRIEELTRGILGGAFSIGNGDKGSVVHVPPISPHPTDREWALAYKWALKTVERQTGWSGHTGYTDDRWKRQGDAK